MSWGFEVRDALGNVTLGVSDIVYLVVAYGAVLTPSTPDQTITVPIPNSVTGDKLLICGQPYQIITQISWSPPNLTIKSRAGSGTLRYVVVR